MSITQVSPKRQVCSICVAKRNGQWRTDLGRGFGRNSGRRPWYSIANLRRRSSFAPQTFHYLRTHWYAAEQQPDRSEMYPGKTQFPFAATNLHLYTPVGVTTLCHWHVRISFTGGNSFR
jgi:hypothetical protein